METERLGDGAGLLEGLGAFFFDLGVKGLGGVFSIFRRTSSRVGSLAMEENHLKKPYAQLLAEILNDKPSERDHYEAFGRFVAAFALAEAQVHTLGRHLSGAGEEKARQIFAGFRLKDSIDRIKAFIRIDRQPKGLYGLGAMGAELEGKILGCLAQIQVISDLRGRLVHRVSNYLEGTGFHITNTFTSASFMTAENQTVTIQNLRDMRYDCGVIFLRLAQITNPLPEFPDLPPQPWLYKPPPPKSPGSKHQKTGKAPQPQPPPLSQLPGKERG